ncbi:MAG: type II toxin-antitoxin system Phd/YefM family antitoxin [Microcoleus sp.]
MKKLKLSQARAPLSDYLAFKLSEPYIVTKNDRPVAALMSVDFADRITKSFNFNLQFIALLNDSESGIKIESQAQDTLIVDALNPDLSLADYIHNLDDRPLILTVDGKLTTVLMPIRDADLETISLSLNPDFIAMLQESRAKLKTEGGISLEQLKQELSELV